MAASVTCEEEAVNSLVQTNPNAIGIALILANDYKYSIRKDLDQLEGPMKDAETAERVFRSLNTICYIKLNATAAVTMSVCKAVANYDYPSHFKWIVVIFAGHGESTVSVLGQDGAKISIQSIIDLYQPLSSPQNGLIPKVLLFDACRGNQLMNTVFVVRARGRGGEGEIQTPRGGTLCDTIKMPASGNMLIAYSTLSNTKAYECEGRGGLWLSTVLNGIEQKDLSITDILNEANGEVVQAHQTSQLMQQPEYNSTLLSNVYFLRESKAQQGLEQKPFEDVEMIEEIIPPLPSLTRSLSESGGVSYTQQLNKFCKEKIIKDRKYTDQSEGHVTLEISLPHESTTVEFNSSTYHEQFNTINEARECVAKKAVEFVQKELSKSYTQTPSTPPPAVTITSREAPSLKRRTSKDPPAVQLKNIIVDELKHDTHPEYTFEEKSGSQKFQCTVSHPLLKKDVTGNWCKGKSNAKQDCASKALILIKEQI